MNTTIETNPQLVLRATAGEADAFTELAERYRPTVFALCLHWTRNPTDADDLTQETLLRAYSSLEQMREPERFGAWLAQIAVNLCKNWRTRTRHDLLPLTAAALQVDERQVNEQQVMHGILLREAMATLSPPLRQVIQWFYVEGFSQKEIAVFSRLPQSTVKGRLDAGRLRLRKEFKKMGLLPTEVIAEGVSEQRVALTDSTPAETKALRAALKAAGYACILIKPQELILPRLHRLQPDLLILNMPFGELDENDIIQAMRIDFRLRDTPLMLLTPRDDRASIFKAWKSGVDCYLTNVRNVRPFNVLEVVAFVERMLRNDKAHEYIALAVEYAWRKQTEAVLRCLERALDLEQNPNTGKVIRTASAFNYLREEPEFIALHARLISDAEWDARAKESDRKREDLRRELEAAAQAEGKPEESPSA